MKTLNQILAAAVLVGSAGLAHADFSISPGYVDLGGSTLAFPYYYGNQTLPYSGTSTIQFTVGGTAGPDTTFLVLQLTGVIQYPGNTGSAGPLGSTPAGANFTVNSFAVNPITGTLTSGAVTGPPPGYGATLTGAGTFDVIVHWTINGGTPGVENNFDINFAVDANANNNVSGIPIDTFVGVTPNTSVPEPSQAIAGITLLGCGGLVFLGRRFVMKKA